MPPECRSWRRRLICPQAGAGAGDLGPALHEEEGGLPGLAWRALLAQVGSQSCQYSRSLALCRISCGSPNAFPLSL